MIILKVLRTAFFLEQLLWLLLNYVLVSERIFKKESLVGRLPLILLVCFMCKYKSLQAGQLPQGHLFFLHNLLNFIITNYLKQEFDDNLTTCVMNIAPVASL